MQLVKYGEPSTQRILDLISPGTMPQDRMGAVSNFLVQQIKVQTKLLFEFYHTRKSYKPCLTFW